MLTDQIFGPLLIYRVILKGKRVISRRSMMLTMSVVSSSIFRRRSSPLGWHTTFTFERRWSWPATISMLRRLAIFATHRRREPMGCVGWWLICIRGMLASVDEKISPFESKLKAGEACYHTFVKHRLRRFLAPRLIIHLITVRVAFVFAKGRRLLGVIIQLGLHVTIILQLWIVLALEICGSFRAKFFQILLCLIASRKTDISP